MTANLNYKFPDPETADSNGLVAVGGNLSPEMLISAYSQGIYPWYSDESPVLWWSPDPRMVLFLSKLKISKSLQQIINQNIFTVKFDTCFKEIIKHCALTKRKGQNGTWITQEMRDAYIKLHNLGYSHSVEVFKNNKLAGGLYGVALGKAFFGESMFYLVNNASKIALFYLVVKLKKLNYEFIDAQQSTPHLRSLGAEDIERKAFLKLLKNSLKGAQLNNVTW